MPKKNSKNVKKKEELPSFLLNLSNHNLERKAPITETKLYSNPIFFGECKQFHGTPHPVSLGGLPSPQYSKISEESLKIELFLSEHELIKEPPKCVKIRFEKKSKEEFIDQFPHRCPGVRKAFVPENRIFTPDLGETVSEIESDTWREIPFCRVRSTLFESSEPEFENVMLSDIKEKNRASLPYEERIAHDHFPKEFVTVKLVGPVIPASITITKIPSKRKRMSDFAFEEEKKTDKIKSAVKTPENEEIKEVQEEAAEEEEEEEEEEEGKVETEENETGEIKAAAEEEREEKQDVEVAEKREPEEGKMEKKEEPDYEKLEEKDEPDDEKLEEKEELDDEKLEEKEAGEALEDGAQIPLSGTVLEKEEGEAMIVAEEEKVEDDKEE